MSFYSELKRRNVIRVAVLYAVASWVLLQVGELLFNALGVPPWGVRLLFALLLLGLPLALIFAWVYELTPEGLKREQDVVREASVTAHTARKLDLIVIVLLLCAVGLVVADRFRGRAGTASTPAPTSPAAMTMPPSAASAVSIAVLPFVNMSEDKANEYFSDGLTEELLNVLANVQGLRVIARTSSFAYKGKDAKIADVAHDLNVDNVLEGSVRKAGVRVRITTQLIRASDSSHLWSETYDRDVNDIFAVQDEISKEVVDALKVRLLQAKASVQETGGTHAPDAYEAYLQGRFQKNKGEGEDSLRAALAAFEEAIRIDPGYARAYVGKAGTLTSLASNAYMPYDTGFKQSRDASMRAIELAPDLAEAYLTLGFVQAADLDVAAATISAEHALQLNPGSFDVQQSYAGFQSSLGNHEAAIAAAKKAIELDPLAPQAYLALASALTNARQYEKAEAVARRAVALAPDRSSVHGDLGTVLLMLGRPDEALAEFELERVQWQRMTGRALVFATKGEKAQARAELAAMLKAKNIGEAASYQFAEINARLGDKDEAFRWLAKAREIRDPGLTATMFVDPILDPIRADPRYDTLARELGFVAKN
ncbi:MAG TPA: tetratricopeptide repeat protein [Steroidobacteraceae bacterium]|nr:tetratricopeptide repeat protein [Steroidobacteraceae bacterium]